MTSERSLGEERATGRRRSHKKYCDNLLTFSLFSNLHVYAGQGDYSTVHRKLLIAAAIGDRRISGVDQSSALRGGGGSGGGTWDSIRGDLAQRAGRNRGEDVRRHDVPLAGEALADPFSQGRVRGRDALSRMPWVSRVRPSPHGRSTSHEVSADWFCGYCGARCSWFKTSCWNCNGQRPPLYRADLGAAGSARRDLSQTPSQARPRARAWDVAARCGELRVASPRQAGHRRSAAATGPQAPHRATTSQSWAARMARADCRSPGSARDLRRATKPMVRAGAAGS